MGNLTTWYDMRTDIQDPKIAAEQLANSYADLEAKITFRNLGLDTKCRRFSSS